MLGVGHTERNQTTKEIFSTSKSFIHFKEKATCNISNEIFHKECCENAEIDGYLS